jgi:hypothetical protein
MRWLENVMHRKEMTNTYKHLIRNLEGMRPLGRHRRRWEDNIKINLINHDV